MDGTRTRRLSAMGECYELNQREGKTVSAHRARSRDQDPMDGQEQEDLARRENFGFNLRRLHHLHQRVLGFQDRQGTKSWGTQRGRQIRELSR